MSSLSLVRDESAIHRAFQLQPECVLGETTILLDLDCANLTLESSSRVDGLALLGNGGLVLAEFKRKVTGKGDTSPSEMVKAMKHRVLYASRHIGKQSVRHLRWHYEMRFINETCTIKEITANLDPSRPLTYIIAAPSFQPEYCVESIADEATASCRDMPLFNLRFVKLEGEVGETGRVQLSPGEMIKQVQLGRKQTPLCYDDAEIKHQHEWVTIPRVQHFNDLLREFIPNVELRSKHSHLYARRSGGYRIGMLHTWGIGLGDVSFSIDLEESNPHCYLQCCKREDIGKNLQPVVGDFRSQVASASHVVDTDVIPYQGRGCYIFVVRFSATTLKNNSRQVARQFADYVQAVIPIVNDYIW